MKFFRTIGLIGIIALGMTCVSARAEPVPLRMMTFNIRTATAPDGENAWPKRRELLADVVRHFDPDVLGVQEAVRLQLSDLAEQLPLYVAVGAGREAEGGGEYSSILYRRGRFDLWESGTFWLSDTPDTPGSTSWGNHYPRICTWVRLLDRKSGIRFFVFNTHWDHQSQRARVGGGQLVAKRISTRGAAEPVVVMGDFNVAEENLARAPLAEIGLRDSFCDLHPTVTDIGTFHGFQGRTEGEKIDAILVDRHWQVEGAAIDHCQRDGRYPSDHFPVTAVLRVVESE